MLPSSEEIITAAKESGKSEEYVDAIAEYSHNLEGKGYPIIFSIVHLAYLVGFKFSYLIELIIKRQSKYGFFKILKKRGGYREIMFPQGQLKYLQKWILINILNNIQLTEASTGFRKNYSIYKNAKVHEGASIILRVDLLKFYDTITENRVRGAFTTMGYVPELSSDLAKIVTAYHRDSYWSDIENEYEKEMLKGLIESKPAVLPQGAPTSPAIANLIANRMDKRFLGLISAGAGFKYSRYADDLIFSANFFRELPEISFIRKVIHEEGFFVNNRKTKYFNKGAKQYVTGLTITNGVNVSKKYRKDILMHLYFCKKFGVTQHLKNWSIKQGKADYNVYGYQDWIFGRIAFVNSINKSAANRMLNEFNKIDWSIN